MKITIQQQAVYNAYIIFDLTEMCFNCLPTFYGTNCTYQCVTNCNNGTCSTGINGTGLCICDGNYDPLTNCTTCLNSFDLTKDCLDCLPTFYGASCAGQCITDCNNNGNCATGINGTGLCICDGNYDAAQNCSQAVKSTPDWVLPVAISASAAVTLSLGFVVYIFICRRNVKKPDNIIEDNIQKADVVNFDDIKSSAYTVSTKSSNS